MKLFTYAKLSLRLLSLGMWPKRIRKNRARIARRFLRGSGLEIGALHMPLKVAVDVKVTYVDYYTKPESGAAHPEVDVSSMVVPDVIDDGETLVKIPSESVDFIIANHMIEHCENFCGTIRTHLEKLVRGGILFYAIPDKRLTFDRKRPLTTFEHLLNDDLVGTHHARYQHYLEFTQYTSGLGNAVEIEKEARRLMDIGCKIHFHVWTRETLELHLASLKRHFDESFDVEYVEQNSSEIVAVLRKR